VSPRSRVLAPALEVTSAIGRAFRAAVHMNRAAISARAGFVAAIPVVGMIAFGTIIAQPVAAVTMGVGAMLSGIAWRAGGGPLNPPLGTMAGAGAALVIATFAGTTSGRWPWLHLGLLVVFCLAAGWLTALGRRGGVVGTQSIIAFVVFGRFPESVLGALTLSGLVLAGVASQLSFAALVARPATWRQQRDALVTGYLRLADVAADLGTSGYVAAEALDVADAKLQAPALFTDPAAVALSNLLSEAWRIRLELTVLRAELERAVGRGEAPTALEAALHQAAGVLRQVAALIAGDAAATQSPSLPDLVGIGSAGGELDPRLEARLAALGGQLGAACRLARRLSGPPDRRTPHPTRGGRRMRESLTDDLRRMRASASLGSPAGRHAVRLAVVVAGTELLTQRVALPRGYWAVVAAATVLRPDFSATFTRGAERMLGTTGGVVVATLIAVALRPSGWGIVVILGLLAWLTYAVFPASFTAGVAALTAVIVFLLHAIAPDSAAIALDRGIDTLIGGTIGLIAYGLWPTWSAMSVDGRLSAVVAAQHRYLSAVLGALVQGRPIDESLRPLSRAARVAWADADAAITLMHDEPVRRGLDPHAATARLAGLRRQRLAIHALRLDGSGLPEQAPLPELSPLAAGFDRTLDLLENAPAGDGKPPLPPLRTLFRNAARRLPEILHDSIDELVDSTNSLAALYGFGIPERRSATSGVQAGFSSA